MKRISVSLILPEVLHQTDGDQIWCGSGYRRILLVDCAFRHDPDDPTLRIGLRPFWAWCHPCHHRCPDADGCPLRLLTTHAQQCHCHCPDGGSLHRLFLGTSSPLALCPQDYSFEMSGYCLLDDLLYPELWTCHHPDVRRSCQRD